MQNKQPLCTTLNKIRTHNPCKEEWVKLLTHLGKTQADDEPLPFHTILESNGIEDAIWCIRTAPEYRKEWNQFLALCLESIQHLMKDERSKAVIKALENDSVTAQIKRDAYAACDDAAAAAYDAYAAYNASAAASASIAYASAAAAADAATATATDATAATAVASIADVAASAVASRQQEREKQAQFFLFVVS